MPIQLKTTCKTFIGMVGDKIIEGLDKNMISDSICATIHLCSDPDCHLHPITTNKTFFSKQNKFLDKKKNITSTILNWDWTPWD
jgi:hypothetical protein